MTPTPPPESVDARSPIDASGRPTPAADRVTELGEGVLLGLGAGPTQARQQIAQLVEGDLRGRASHGMQRLPTLAARIRNGVLDPVAQPDVGSGTGDAAIVVDGRAGFGPTAALAGLEAAVAAARRFGVSSAAIHNSGHVGMLAPYVERLAGEGLVCIALTTSEALVHPAGGRKALVGTNPIGIGVPLQPEPFVLDMSTAAISAGEVIAHRERGDRLPPGSAVDPDGRPTSDPSAALRGAISPFGGGKGYALGLGIELLVAALTATEVGDRVHGTLDTERRPTKGDVFIVIDAASVQGGSRAERLGAYLDELRASPTAPGVERVLIPGDRMRNERSQRLRDGIPYAAETWRQLVELEEDLAEDA